MVKTDAERKQATEFVRNKCHELAIYMETQGWPKEVTASVMLGLGVGWIVAARGIEVARKGTEMALAGAEQVLNAEANKGKPN